MFFPKLFFTLVCVAFMKLNTIATTYTTAVNGNWNNIGCWVGGAVPSFDCADSIIIKHHLILPSNLVLQSGAYLIIESNGGLCGHFQINVNNGVNLLKYGILEIDALNQSGGAVTLLPPGNTIFTQYGLITGGTFDNTSNFMVGPWFECQLPEYQFLNGLDDHLTNLKLQIFPNPATNYLTLNLPASTAVYNVLIFDDKGSIVYQKEINHSQNRINIEELITGLYFIQLITNQSLASAKFSKR